MWYQSASPNLAGQQLGGSWGVQHQYSASTVQNSLPKGSTEVLSGVRKRRMGLSVFIEHDSLESLCPWNVDCWELCFFLQPRMSLHGFCFYFPSVYGTVLLSCVEGRGWSWWTWAEWGYHQRNLKRMPGQVWKGLCSGWRSSISRPPSICTPTYLCVYESIYTHLFLLQKASQK